MTSVLGYLNGADGDSSVFLVILLIGFGIAMLVYTIMERSQGAERRAARRRKAREVVRGEREARRKVARTLPRAVAQIRNDEPKPHDDQP